MVYIFVIVVVAYVLRVKRNKEVVAPPLRFLLSRVFFIFSVAKIIDCVIHLYYLYYGLFFLQNGIRALHEILRNWNMDPNYLQNYHVFIFDSKNDFKTWRMIMENFFKIIGIWDIIETGYTKPTAGTESSSDAFKELERNRQLNCKALFYLNTQVQLHGAKKFIHAKLAKEGWTILVNSNRGAANVRRIRL